MGRHSIGKRPMTPAERQRRRRSRLAAEKNKTLPGARADLVAAITRLLTGMWQLQARLDESHDRVCAAMGHLKKLHAEVNDMPWD